MIGPLDEATTNRLHIDSLRLHPDDRRLILAHVGQPTQTAVREGRRDPQELLKTARRYLGRRATHARQFCTLCPAVPERTPKP